MTERRDRTTTEGRGLGFSFAEDNLERGSPDFSFVKRRPTYTWGDDPRGREIKWEAQNEPENLEIFRAYRGLVPIEGQDVNNPQRTIDVGSSRSLRPPLPSRSVDHTALEKAKQIERARFAATDFSSLFPTAVINAPSSGASVSRGNRLTIIATVSDFRSVTAATLEIDGKPVDRKNLDRSEQDSTFVHQFYFYFDVPSSRPVGSMTITIRGFNKLTDTQGIIASGATTTAPEIKGATNRDGEIIGVPLVDFTGYQRSPEAVVSIVVNVI